MALRWSTFVLCGLATGAWAQEEEPSPEAVPAETAAPDTTSEPAPAPEIEVRELKIERRVFPRYPNNAPPDLEMLCEGLARVDERGRPMEIRLAESCPDPFAASVHRALQKWRWEPYEIDGEPVVAWTTVKVWFNPHWLQRPGEEVP